MKRVFCVVIFFLLLTSMFVLAFNIQPVKANPGAIYIRSDGSIDPSDAPISTIDNVTYTLTGDIISDADGIVVERDNIVVDGGGYTLKRKYIYGDIGTCMIGRKNVTIKNTNIESYWYGIYLDSSSGNTISGNNIANPQYGIYLDSSSSYNTICGNNATGNYECGICLSSSSSHNSISGNNVTNNWDGITLAYLSNYNTISGNNIAANHEYGIYLYDSSSPNSVFHNNFINNAQQVYSSNSAYVLDDSYPSAGNYWSDDYNGKTCTVVHIRT